MGNVGDIGNSSPSVAFLLNDVACVFLSRDPMYTVFQASDRPGQAFEQVLRWGWVHGIEMA